MTVTDIRVPASRRAPARKWSWFKYTVVIVGPALVCAMLGYIARRAQEPDAGGEIIQPQAAATIPGRAFPGAEIDFVGKGLWSVPDQAPPGTYSLAATGNTLGCGWHRLSAKDGKPKSVIEEGVLNPRGGFGEFTIASTDRWVKLDGGCTWARQ